VGHCVRALLSTAVLCCLIVCGACVQGQGEVAPHRLRLATANLANRAQEVLELFANVDEPGCSAAVARRGEVSGVAFRALPILRRSRRSRLAPCSTSARCPSSSPPPPSCSSAMPGSCSGRSVG